MKNQNQRLTDLKVKSNKDKPTKEQQEEFEQLMRMQMEWECREEKGKLW